VAAGTPFKQYKFAESTTVRRSLISKWPQGLHLSNCGLFDQSATVEPTNVWSHLIYSETAEPLDVRGCLIVQDRRHLIYETADIVRPQIPSM